MSDAYKTVRTMTAPCGSDSWDKAAGQPNALAKRVELIKQLRQQIQQFEQERVATREDGWKNY